jgi:glycosyltransferase involved in cell wall biosynthesis
MAKRAANIATVLPPLTMASSALAFHKSISLETAKERNIWVPENYDMKIFIHSHYKGDWIQPWKVYTKPNGVVWLVKLFFSLVNGRFNLFISTNGPEGLLAFVTSKLLRKPIIVNDTTWFWASSVLSHLYWPFARYVSKHCAVFCVVGSRVVSFWRQSGLEVEKAEVVHFYVSQAKLSRTNIMVAKQLKEKYCGKKIVLYLGRLIRRKGVDYLLDAFANVTKEVPETVLIIAGEGPEKLRLQKRCRELSLNNVVFTGYVSEEEKAGFFLLSDFIVYPTVTIIVPEEWGLAVNEAMSVGKPAVVTTAVGCAFELVKPGITGFVVPEKDAMHLSDAIKKLLIDDESRIRMGEASKELIKREYTYSQMDSRMNEVVKSILFG